MESQPCGLLLSSTLRTLVTGIFGRCALSVFRCSRSKLLPCELLLSSVSAASFSGWHSISSSPPVSWPFPHGPIPLPVSVKFPPARATAAAACRKLPLDAAKCVSCRNMLRGGGPSLARSHEPIPQWNLPMQGRTCLIPRARNARVIQAIREERPARLAVSRKSPESQKQRDC